MDFPPDPLEIRYSTKSQALEASRGRGAALELCAPVRSRYPLGRAIRTIISFDDGAERFELWGRISFQRQALVSGAPGLGVSFEGPQRERALEMFQLCAGKGGPVAGALPFKRVVTSLPSRMEIDQQWVSALTLDLSLSGLFAEIPANVRVIPSPGTQLVLRIRTGLLSFLTRPLSVQVVWRGEKRGRFGFGGRFLGSLAARQRILGPLLDT